MTTKVFCDVCGKELDPNTAINHQGIDGAFISVQRGCVLDSKVHRFEVDVSVRIRDYHSGIDMCGNCMWEIIAKADPRPTKDKLAQLGVVE